MLTRQERPFRQGGDRYTETWAWLMQRLTSVFLLIFLGAHLWILHYALVNQPIDFASVSARLRSPIFVGLDIGLLVLVAFHALNGLRTVLLDFAWFQRRRTTTTWILGASLCLVVVFGVVILLPLLQGVPPR